MNKDNLYDNTLENLVDYYAACCKEYDRCSWDYDLQTENAWGSPYVKHAPSEVLEVILDKFQPKM